VREIVIRIYQHKEGLVLNYKDKDMIMETVTLKINIYKSKREIASMFLKLKSKILQHHYV